MVLDPITSAPAPPPLLDVALETEATDLQIHRDLVVAGMGMRVDVAQRLYGDGCLDDPDLAIVIGRADFVPVATAMLVTSDETAGVFNVVTFAEHRGKGYGAAVTWRSLPRGLDAGAPTPCSNPASPATPSTTAWGSPSAPTTWSSPDHPQPDRTSQRGPIELAPHGQHSENDARGRGQATVTTLTARSAVGRVPALRQVCPVSAPALLSIISVRRLREEARKYHAAEAAAANQQMGGRTNPSNDQPKTAAPTNVARATACPPATPVMAATPTHRGLRSCSGSVARVTGAASPPQSRQRAQGSGRSQQ